LDVYVLTTYELYFFIIVWMYMFTTYELYCFIIVWMYMFSRHTSCISLLSFGCICSYGIRVVFLYYCLDVHHLSDKLGYKG